MAGVDIVESFPQTSPKLIEKPLANSVREPLAPSANHSCGNARSTCESHSQTTSPKPAVSVIVPVYKVEKYLRACIDSILAQTFTDFELILVDDGSPDNCGAICDEYAQKDARIRVFHKPNGGVTSARRLGVEHSRAEWVMFVDSDDMIAPFALESLFNYASDDVDLVEGKVVKENFKKEQCEVLREVDGLNYAIEVASQRGFWVPGPCSKILRKNILIGTNALNISREIYYGEDLMMLLIASGKIRKVKKVNSEIYFYRTNFESVSKTFKMTAAYFCFWLKELEKITISRGNSWHRVWYSVAMHYYELMFLYCPDFSLKNEYIQNEMISRGELFLGEKCCLVVSRFPAFTHSTLRRILIGLIALNSLKIRAF